jgi:hypothetical protein
LGLLNRCPIFEHLLGKCPILKTARTSSLLAVCSAVTSSGSAYRFYRAFCFALTLAHLARCAAAIFFLALTLIYRRLRVGLSLYD